MTESELKKCFLKLRDGDKKAFVEVYNALKQPIFVLVCRIVQNKTIAEDITHDVFLKLFSSPPDPSVKNLRAWIFQLARNLSIDTLRKKQCAELSDETVVTDNCFDLLVQRIDIEAAIAKLPRDEREILSLHINGGLSFKEISRIEALSLPSVYRRYRKAISTLGGLL